MSMPTEWHQVAVHPVGGLSEVGFTEDESLLLVVSVSGRGLFDTSSGERVARDRAEPVADSPWLDERLRTVEGIGAASGQKVKMVGLWGGNLATETADGWRVRRRGRRSGEVVVLGRVGQPGEWLLDEPITELRAFGFSLSGRVLVVATSSDVAIFGRSG